MDRLESQYRAIKAQHHGAVLLFRLGDRLEAFFGDAVTVAEVMGLDAGGRRPYPWISFPAADAEDIYTAMAARGLRIKIMEEARRA